MQVNNEKNKEDIIYSYDELEYFGKNQFDYYYLSSIINS